MTKAETQTGRIRWRWGVGVGIAFMLLSLFPQAHFMVNRGREWQGANAISHPDEVAYSAYLASVIRGNPRRFDPFTGREQVPESLFSVQFVPVYAAALPARVFGLPAPLVFMILTPLCAVASSLAIFWFLLLLTRDQRFSAAAVVIVLGFGTVMAGQGLVRHVLNLNFLIPQWIANNVAPTSLYHLPFLRLYQPAVAFPLFFGLAGLVWLALNSSSRRQAFVLAGFAGVLLAALIFSYFYLWTTALGFLVCAGGWWWWLRKSERRRAIVVFGTVVAIGAAALVPYFRMLSRRAATVDAAQALVFTHRPDLFRLPEIVALLVLILLGLGIARARFHADDPSVVFGAAFALTVMVVFNQQVITGRSLQPVHYQWFIANYCALIAVVLTIAVWRRAGGLRRLTNNRLALVAVAAFVLAFGEVWLAASVAFDYNRRVDDSLPVSTRLTELAPANGAVSPVQVVLMSDLKLADRLPTDAPQAVLWAPRMLVFPGVTEAENRERFFQHLYYLGYDEKRFWTQLNQSDWNFLAGMFSYNRLSPAVTGTQTPITLAELRAQLATYLDYSRSFDAKRARTPQLSYLVVRADSQPDYANLDRWYQRDAGERIGGFVLYKLKLRE